MTVCSLILAFVERVKRRGRKKGAPCPAPPILRFNSHPPFCAGHAGYVYDDDLEYHRILLLRETQSAWGVCYNHGNQGNYTTRVES